ncbi:MAG: tetratricopeptide repeat protein [Proteobacteria bacterium]|nr:tetratricopeptide repeat protein [Pseudomonadota bacterium]
MKRITAALENPRIAWLALLAPGAVLYGVLLARYTGRSPFAAAPFLDSRYYWGLAVETGILGRPLPDVLFNAPLYPLVLAAWVRIFGAHLGLVYVLQAALALGTALLARRATARIFSPREGFVAGLLALFYGPLAFQTLKILPEALALFLFSAFLALFTLPGILNRKWGPPALGAVAGLCILTRSQLLLPLAASLPFLFWGKSGGSAARRPGRAAVLLLALGLTLLPWALRNLAATGRPAILAANGGLTLYEGNNPDARGSYARVLEGPEVLEDRVRDMKAEAARALSRPVTVWEADAFFRDRALAWMAENPGAWLKLEAAKALMILRPRESPIIYDPYAEQREFTPWLSVFFVGWGLLLSLALAGFFDAARPSRDPGTPFLVPLSVMAACLILTLLVFMPVSRYRLLLVPVLLPFAARGIFALAGWWRGGRRGLALAGAALLVAGLAGDALDRPGPTVRSQELAARSLARTGRPAEAEARFLAILEENPGRAATVNDLIVLHLWEGRLGQAQRRVLDLARLPGQESQAAYYRKVLEQARRDFGPGDQGAIPPTRQYHDFLDRMAGGGEP